MKIIEVKIEESLPPHLAKFFDKDGNYNTAAQARIDAGRKKPRPEKWKDATPKGYGPDEVDEAKRGLKEEVEIEHLGVLYKVSKFLDPDSERHKGEWNIFIWDDKYRDWGWDRVIRGRKNAINWIKSKTEVDEGYTIVPKVDSERYGERPGLEGPFRFLSGIILYYDPKEGKYYDPDSDMYLTYDEFTAHTTPRKQDPERISLMTAMREEHKKTLEGYSSGGKYYSAGDPNFLIRELIDGRPGTRWSIMNYKDTSGSNPLSLRTELNQHAKSVGFDGYTVIGQWVGDLDKVLEYANSQLNSNKNWIDSIKHDLDEKVRTLTNAKKVMAAGEEVGMSEAKPTSSDYAIGMAQAKKSTGDTKPLRKSTIKKGHKIARAVANEDAQDVANDKIKKIEAGIDVYMKNKPLLGRSMPLEFAREMAIVIAANLEADGGEVIGGMEEDKRDIKSVKKTKSGTKYQMKSGTMVYDMKEGMPPANQAVIVAHKGKKIGSFEVRHGAKVHHIDQELCKLSKSISLENFERTKVARDLVNGKIARSGDFAFQIQDIRPKELE